MLLVHNERLSIFVCTLKRYFPIIYQDESYVWLFQRRELAGESLFFEKAAKAERVGSIFLCLEDFLPPSGKVPPLLRLDDRCPDACKEEE